MTNPRDDASYRCRNIDFKLKIIVKSVLLTLLILSVIGCMSKRERESAGIVLVFKHGKIAPAGLPPKGSIGGVKAGVYADFGREAVCTNSDR